MVRRQYVFTFFVGFLLISFIIIMIDTSNVFGIGDGVRNAFLPFGKKLVRSSQGEMTTVEKLQEENQELKQKLAAYTKLQEDNEAFRDQFEHADPPARQLVAGDIVGAPGFIPGNIPEYLIIDKGKKQGVADDMPVVYKNMLIGRIVKVSDNFAQVMLITNKKSSITAKDQTTGALGIVRGQGEDLLLDNVILSEKLAVGDIVVTHGDMTVEGRGYPPGFLLGKISSVEKSQSALFQRASLTPLIDILHLSKVFVVSIK